jgi:membrane protein implicated in regulation of membrane protease activity
MGLGLLLALSELLATFFVLIWLGVAAFVVGLLSLVLPVLGLEDQLMAFGVVAALLFLPARRLRGRMRGSPHAAAINDRAAQLVGRVVTLKEPIAQGHGRVFVGDTLWHVEGPDLPAGAAVRVVSYTEAVLLVEPAD